MLRLALFKHDDLTIIIDNGYSAATGGQDIMSSEADNRQRATRNTIERAVKGVGVGVADWPALRGRSV